MVTIEEFEPDFVEFIPSELAPGVLYISMDYATCSHLCACGCGARRDAAGRGGLGAHLQWPR